MLRSAAVSLFLVAGSTLAMAQQGPTLERYIVVLKPNTGLPANVAEGVARAAGGEVGYVYNHALRGFSITIPPAARFRLERDPRIASFEEDIPVTAFVQEIPTGVNRIFANRSALQINGVDDHRVNVDVAVLDTGIDREHPDLNVVGGTNCLGYVTGRWPWQRTYYCTDNLADGDDDNYHGTHVAGTIGALDNGIGVVGVAPGARLWAVKVLDSQGSGQLSGIIAGIDWVTAAKSDTDLTNNIEVINMSLGGTGTNSAMNTAVANAVAAGITVVVAAGNNDADAKNYTPANAPDAITVSALADFNGLAGGGGSATCRSDIDDTLADFSNWGSTIEIAAPGVCILSTYPLERGEYGTISGTSMASPHVAGAAALLASSGKTPAEIRGIFTTKVGDPAKPVGGNYNWVDDSGDGVQEPLLDISNAAFSPAMVASSQSGVGGDTGGGTPGSTPPTASFNWSAAGLTVNFYDTSTAAAGDTILEWNWDFGDDGTSTVQNPTHTYAAGGNYKVTLVVTDDDNDIGTKLVEVSVTAPKGKPVKNR